MTQVNFAELTDAIHLLFEQIQVDIDPEARQLKFSHSHTHYSIKFKSMGEAELYTVEAFRPLTTFDKLLQTIAEHNINMSWCKVYYREGLLFLSVSSLYPADVSVAGVIKGILQKILSEYNNLYDTIENARTNFSRAF
mmetsp:Transcript_32782/g.57043  ORF Transcript_32782/g.57043 Transcript_32782/m.57043 type:complete len:138 (-) Transcript_32782:1683-2096(-)